uniref:Reverse transcriptase domain-containing protein n=1 Tax=Loa loa TaxID=7209 RepID=A0A1I7VJI2_LOALO
VTFESQLGKHTNAKQSSKSSNDSKKSEVEFYDSDEDEDNERWVRHHREQLKIVKSLNNSPKKDTRTKQKKDQDHETDAVLSCPAWLKPNAVVDPANITTLPKEDLFHPVFVVFAPQMLSM